MSAPFPLVTLQPVSDTRDAWVALLLEAVPALDATALARVFGEFGLADALEGLPCVVMVPDVPADIAGLPAEKIVLCLPAEVCCDRANDAALAALQAKGFHLMLNGVPAAGQEPFAGVQALAVPCPGVGTSPVAAGWLKKLPGPHMALGAQVVCPGRCHFQWLAGHFAENPKPQHHKGGDAPNQILLLELLAKVANDADSHEIEAVIKRDPQLSYHLLKLVNSVAFSLTKKIASFNQAIALLGRRQLQRWLQLLLYARSGDDGANPLLPRVALRAALAEALARSGGATQEVQDRAFMAGMFSLLDVLLGMPLAEITKPLNLADDVAGALADHAGRLGTLLAVVEAAEKGDRNALAARLAEAGIGNEDWLRCVIEAGRWAIQVSREA